MASGPGTPKKAVSSRNSRYEPSAMGGSYHHDDTTTPRRYGATALLEADLRVTATGEAHGRTSSPELRRRVPAAARATTHEPPLRLGSDLRDDNAVIHSMRVPANAIDGMANYLGLPDGCDSRDDTAAQSRFPVRAIPRDPAGSVFGDEKHMKDRDGLIWGSKDGV